MDGKHISFRLVFVLQVSGTQPSSTAERELGPYCSQDSCSVLIIKVVTRVQSSWEVVLKG